MKQDDQTNQKITELELKIEELENNWKRALADYKNLEKRVREEKSDIVTYSNLVLLAELIPVLDHLEMLEKHLKDQGLKMILSQFENILKAEGLEEVDALNQDFNPLLMEAVETIEGQPNKVLEVEQKGYKIKSKLIRPAKVKVGKNIEE